VVAVRRWIVTALALTACGRIGFAVRSGDDDDTFGSGALTYHQAVLDDSPVAYWRLADSGSVAHDETGAHDGSYVGTCTHGVAGALANDPDLATRFDGSTCEVMLDTGLEFAGNAPFTLEPWVSETAGQAIAHYITRESRSGNSPVDGYALLDYDGQGGVYMERVANMTITHSPALSIARGQFVYVVGTYDGAALQLYLDGNAVATPVTDSHAVPTFSTNALLARQPGGFFFGGVLDEVAIYDHALAADRIALHHQIGVAGPQ